MKENINHTILIVDDEPDILDFFQYNLEKEGFEVFTATNGLEGLKMADEINPDLIVLDIMMPELDGIETCQQLRANEKFKNTLIAFLTARNEDYSQIVGFESGADDYIAKPIRPKVLVSRLKALLKRKNQILNDYSSENIVRFGALEIDKERVQVKINEELIVLAKKEFELLVLLSSRPGKVFNRQEIFNKIWGDDVIVGNRTIDVHIRKLREKIGEEYIVTFKGIGYKFEF